MKEVLSWIKLKHCDHFRYTTQIGSICSY